MRNALHVTLAFSLVIMSMPVRAQEAAPNPDAALDQLVAMDPAALAAHVLALKAQAIAQKEEATKLRADADQLDQQSSSLAASLDALGKHLAALNLTVNNPDDGMPWDFSLKSTRSKHASCYNIRDRSC